MALLEIKCPLCKGVIWVEQSTGKVVDHKSADQKKADFSAFIEGEKSRAGQWDDRIQKVRDESARRKAEWEERFKHAREHPDELKGDVENPFKWE
jgi:phage FluMu protein Com